MDFHACLSKAIDRSECRLKISSIKLIKLNRVYVTKLIGDAFSNFLVF